MPTVERPPAASPPPFLTDQELQRWLRVDRQTTFRWRTEDGLPHHYVGSSVRYRRDEVEAWIAERTAERRVVRQGGRR